MQCLLHLRTCLYQSSAKKGSVVEEKQSLDKHIQLGRKKIDDDNEKDNNNKKELDLYSTLLHQQRQAENTVQNEKNKLTTDFKVSKYLR